MVDASTQTDTTIDTTADFVPRSIGGKWKEKLYSKYRLMTSSSINSIADVPRLPRGKWKDNLYIRYRLMPSSTSTASTEQNWTLILTKIKLRNPE